MVRSDSHGPAQRLALSNQRRKAFTYAGQFFGVGVFSVFEDFEFFLVRVISGVDPDFLYVVGGNFCRMRGEVDVGNQRNAMVSRFIQSCANL